MAMRATRFTRGLGILALATALGVSASASTAADPVFVKQGNDWTPARRADFYTRDQGSPVIPLAWLRALRTADGAPFLGDGLARYGYLPNPSGRFNLPIGFMPTGPQGRDAGMNCSACHTRQVNVGGQDYRIDGGPALVDFQGFLTDLDASVGGVLADDSAFAAFAAAAMANGDPSGSPAVLRPRVAAWYERFHTIVSRSLAGVDWGLGRLDAVSMIYNRVVGLDIGPAPSFLIPENIAPADAPVRYPFLWNAPKQDRTQWPGFAKNGDRLFAMARNLGQVYGVFGVLQTQRRGDHVDFLINNSANWDGLERIETLVQKIGWPRWPWPINAQLAAQGKRIYDRDWQQGGCAGCHGKRSGAFRFIPPSSTWATPLCDVGTDTKQYGILHRTVRSGVLEGAAPPFGQPMGATADTFSLLSAAVIGSIAQKRLGLTIFKYGPAPAPASAAGGALGVSPLSQLLSVYAPPTPQACGKEGGVAKYESRVMEGIWATAPYLHNGSVPTLADLLKPASDRPKAFQLGNRYDTELVGLARVQPSGAKERDTKGCGNRDSGESRCGHEYGTHLSDAEKRALLEYLKSI
jgi:mono/diheme cytochrome c family protein